MYAALRVRVGNPTTTEVPNLTLIRVINSAYDFIISRYPFHETRRVASFSTVNGTARYTVPSDLLSLLRVWDETSRRKIVKRGVRYLASLPKNLATGEPKAYVRTTNWIEFVPTPSAVYSMRLYYLSKPADLALDADVPLIPATWHEGILAKARHIYYDERGDIGKAVYSGNAWKEWVADKPSEIDAEKDDMDDQPVILPELGGRDYSRTAGYDELFDYLDY